MFRFLKALFSPVIIVLDFITKYFKTIVFLTIIYFVVISNNDVVNTTTNSANLEKIKLFGPIMDASSILEKIEKAKNNANIKGVLLEVNSPGGAVAPSVEIMYALQELKHKKPVIAYASGIMASGSYYASIWADKIFANPGSMIGSIGVIMQGMNVEELMNTLGIKTQTVKAGKYKESGTPTRAWTKYEKSELEKVIDDTYDMFITDVANARKLKKSDHEKFANAHIFTARQAKKVGLIDEVTTLNNAKRYLVKIAKVKSPVWKKEDKMDKFLDKLINETISNVSMRLTSGLKAY